MSDDQPFPALPGATKLLGYFIVVASAYDRTLVAGPVWNMNDSLIPGDIQYLRYTFVDSTSQEIAFATQELKKYGIGDAVTVSFIEQKIHSLIDLPPS
jgi:hypothetical protein